MKITFAPALFCLACLAPRGAGQAEILEILGYGPPRGISADGRTIVLSGTNVWKTGALLDLAGATNVYACNADGTAFVGYLGLTLPKVAGRWIGAGPWAGLGGLPVGIGCNQDLSIGLDISDAGDVVVGSAWQSCGVKRAALWTAASGTMIALPSLAPGPKASIANCVSLDGSTIGGSSQDANFASRAIRWQSNGVGGFQLEVLSAGAGSVLALDATGTVAVGQDGNHAAIWRLGQPVQILPDLLGSPGAVAVANAVSSDGATVVGSSVTSLFVAGDAFLYRADVGVVSLEELAQELGASIPAGKRLAAARGISADGTIVVGELADADAVFPTPGDTYRLVLPKAWLQSDVAGLSLAAGGTQTMSLNAGPDQAGNPYLVLGSASGTEPGLPTAAGQLPLNPDFYFDLTLLLPNNVLQTSFGTLDGLGRATTSLTLAPGGDPAFLGTTLQHAYVTLGIGASVTIERVSNPVGLLLGV